MVGIFIGPIPLMPDRLQGHLGILGAVGEIQQLERGNDDDHQNHDGDRRPHNLQQGIVGRGGWFRIVLGREFDQDVDHQHRDEHGDDHADDHEEIMEFVDLCRNRRHRILQAQLPGMRHAMVRLRGQAGQACAQQRYRREQFSPSRHIKASIFSNNFTPGRLPTYSIGSM